MEFNAQIDRLPDKQPPVVYVIHLNEPGEWNYCILTLNILRIPRVSFATATLLYNTMSLNMPKRLKTQRSNICVINLN